MSVSTRCVIYSAHQPYALRAAEMVRESAGWEPVYWLCESSQMEEVAGRFGAGVIRHNYLDAVRGLPAPAFADQPVTPFDPARLDPLAESIALAMLERNDSYSDSMAYRERVDYVLTGLGYWCLVIDRTGADTVVFEELPHQAADFLLYTAAKKKGLVTIVPVRGLPDAGFQPNDTLGAVCPPVATGRPSRAPGVRPNTGAEDFLARMSLDYRQHLDAMFWDHKDSIKQITQDPTNSRRLLDLAKGIVPRDRLARYWHNLRTFRNDQKVTGVPLRRSEMSYPAFLWNKTRTLAKKSRLQDVYASLTTADPDLRRPFIYCCLQYQPEASTSPLAGRYVYQWLMIEQLAAVLPEGWSLYVKEHPSQFSGEYARYGETFRSRAFYERLLANGRTKLMPLTLDSFTLIDRAKAVAGPGGTVCFEAVARGKPAINFGGGFFVGCPGLFQVSSARDVADAVTRVYNGAVPDAGAVREFARAIDRATYPGAIGGPNQLERMGVDVEENARLHQQCWLEVASWHEDVSGASTTPAGGSAAAGG